MKLARSAGVACILLLVGAGYCLVSGRDSSSQPGQVRPMPGKVTLLAAEAETNPATGVETVRIDPGDVLHPVPAVRGVMTEWMFSQVKGSVPASQPTDDVISPTDLREEDYALAARMGVNTIRLAIHHPAVEDPKQPGQYNEAAFRHIQRTLDWYAKYDIQAILDIHNALGREGGGDPRLWQDVAFQDRFVNVWKEIVRRFKDNPQVIAYEPLNEPEPRHTADWAVRYGVWNKLAQRVSQAIREIDPVKPIIIDSIEYGNASAFAGLEPTGQPNTVYSFHWYAPSQFHQQKRPTIKDQGTYHYPDTYYGEKWDRNRILKGFEPALEFARKNKVPLFCGEFGCVSDTPEMEDMVWLLDVVSAFDQNDIGWTYFHFMMRTDDKAMLDRGGFDCNLFLYDLPGQRLRTMDRKVSLMSDLMKLRGQVLNHGQPADTDLTVYGVLTTAGQIQVYVSNKSRQQAKSLTLALPAEGWAPSVAVKRMARGTNGFVDAPAGRVSNGKVELTLEPLTIQRLVVRPKGAF